MQSVTCPECEKNLDSSGSCPACLLKLAASVAPEPTPDAAPFAMPTPEELNDQFPQLEVTRLIGRGGMGAIYHARQTALDRDVAVKLIARELSGDTAFLDRFDREAKALAKLSHPNIVTVFDYGHTQAGGAYLAMEFVDGTNLRDLIKQSAVSRNDALELISNICRALQYAHSKGVVHRDIKPENILLSHEGTVKLADFGIAKILDESVKTPTLTATRQVLGSLHYLAPEHMEAPESVDHRVDLYALGVVLYELLTGELPLGRFEPASSLVPDVDHDVDEIINKAMSRKPSERYQSAAELAEAVDNVRAAVAVKTHSQHAGGRVGKNVSVPFTADTLGGFAEAVGMLHASGDKLTAEFRMRDAIWGGVKSQTHVVEIPRENLTRLELNPSVFSAKLAISTETITQLGELPNAETGVVELKIKRSDTPYAKQLLQNLGYASNLPKYYGVSDGNESNRLFFAVMLFVCAALNMGFLAAIITAAAFEIHGGEKAAVIIAMSMLYTPIFVVQIVAAACNLAARPKGISLAATVLSMIPITPAWLLSFPLAIWARRWLIEKEPPQNAQRAQIAASGMAGAGQADAPTKSWGATTMMFIRETRSSRLFAALNVLALVGLVVGLIAYKRGVFQGCEEISFRAVPIADTVVDRSAFRDAVFQRLTDFDAYVNVRSGSDTTGQTFEVTAYERDVLAIKSTLRISQPPQLLWVPYSPDSENASGDLLSATSEPTEAEIGEGENTEIDSPDTESIASVALSSDPLDESAEGSKRATPTHFPVMRGAIDDGLAEKLGLEKTGLGFELPIQSEVITLSDSSASGASVRYGFIDERNAITDWKSEPFARESHNPNLFLTIRLTASGRRALREAMPDGEAALALVIEGMVYSCSTSESLGNRELRFTIPENAKFSELEILAAIRGPALGFEVLTSDDFAIGR